MSVFRVALLQLQAAGGAPSDNLARGIEACREAAAEGADLALFPEMWQLGYTPCPEDPDGRHTWQALAIEHSDPWLESFRAEARRLDMAIVATYAFDGVAFEPDGTWRDHELVEAGEGASIVYADIDLSLLRAYRRREAWGDAYRKPYTYEALVRASPRPPFVRGDARRDAPIEGD